MATLKSIVELSNEWAGFGEIYTELETPMKSAINSIDHNHAEAQIKKLISECDCVETLKSATIKFDGVKEFFSLEDQLVGIIGDDDYDSFLDDNDL